jgi:hypothetical protein
MGKALCVLVILAFIVVGCVCEGPAKSRRSGEKYYPVKVCSIGDTDGSTCVEYAAKSYNPSGNDLTIHTLDGHTYRFNNSGWAWVVTTR